MRSIVPAFSCLTIFFFCLSFVKLSAQAPTITSFSPASSSVGTLVTINGTNLGNPTAFNIGAVAAIVVSKTSTNLVGMVMPGATTGAVTVTTSGGLATAVGNFSVTATPYPSVQQGAKLVGIGAVGLAGQGQSVAVSSDGNTAIVGGISDNRYAGAAWVYTRSGGVWTQQGAKLVGTGAVGASYQGCSVSISSDGNTAIIGGYSDNGDRGAAWIYTRSGGVWTQQGTKLVGTGAVGFAQQGNAVSISSDGNTAIVGGRNDNSGAGATWIYVRSGGVWSQQGAKLVSTGAVGNARQGFSVCISSDGNTAIAGGFQDNSGAGAAWIYSRSGAVWTQQGIKLVGTGAVGVASQGYSVAISSDGNTAIVGGPDDVSGVGAAWVYTRLSGIWAQQGAKLKTTEVVGLATQGRSVSISSDGNIAIVGSSNEDGGRGAARIYTRVGGVWAQRGPKLIGTGATAASQGTVSISSDGRTAIVGGPADNSGVGAVWIYNAEPTITSFTPTSAGKGGSVTITGTNFTGTTAISFGGTMATSFAVVNSTTISAVVAAGSSGNVSVTNFLGTATIAGFTFVAAPTITSFTPASGSVGTLVTINGTNLGNPTAINIGAAAAIIVSNTNTQVVGMVMPGATTGAVTVTTAGGVATGGGNFSVTATSYPSAQQGVKLVGSGSIGAAAQGQSVSISADGNTAIVGGANDNLNAGAAWLYTRSGGLWSQQGSKLVGSGSIGAAAQGRSVSISADGNTAIVGGVDDNFSTGAAWVYTRTGGVWTQQGAKLVGTGAIGAAKQGTSISISADGNTAIVGGFYDNSNKGAVWIYTRSDGVWTQQGGKLVGTAAVGNSYQGLSVSISSDGNTALVGGYADNLGTGAVWVYTRSGGGWTQQGAKLVGTGAIGAGNQGTSVAVSSDGNTAIVGGYYDNVNKGAAWVFIRIGGVWTQQGEKLIGTGAVLAAQQGYSVSISADGNTAIVGGVNDASGVGGTWIYTRSNGVWTQRGEKLVGSGNAGTSVFQGCSVAISLDGNAAIVGGYGDNSNAGAAWIFTQPPVISAYTPVIATTGAVVTVTGQNFTGANAVSFGGIAATSFSVVNNNTITAVVGSGASGSVSVTTSAGTATKSGFTYGEPSLINSFVPASGKFGDTLLINGSNLTGVTGVSFGNIPANWFAVQNATTIKAVVGLGASGNVSISTQTGTATLAGFTYTGVTISSFTPATAASGATVTINGTSLSNVYSIMFGSALADNFTVVNANTITAIVGRGASGSVSVTDVNGSASKPGFNFVQAPTITSITPAIIGQGDEVNIAGTNFTNVSTVKFGGTNVASYSVVSSTLIKAVAGIGTTGAVDVVTPGGTAVGTNIFYTRNLCPGASTIFTSDVSGTSYQWQLNTGSGFNNLVNNIYYTGVTNSSLQLTNAPTSFYGYQYRCVVNSSYSKTIIIRFATTWTGAINSLWGNTGNWGCSTLPDSSTDVKINSGTVLLSNDTTIRSLVLKTGANLLVQPGKKLKITGKGKNIAKVALGPAEVLLYANTPGLIMLKGEQAILTIRQITSNPADTIPTGLTFSSSDASVATFGSDGKVTALQTGVCKVTATNAQGKKMTCQVAVIATISPLLNEPVFVAFASPLLYINTDNRGKINAWALNRLGQKLADPVTVVLLSKDLQQQAAANSVINTEDGMYILSATVAEKALIGGSSAVVYKNINSTVLGEASPAVLASAITNPPAGIYSIVLEAGKYPKFFTKAGVTSEPVHALVFRMVPYEIMAAGTPTGTFGLTISTSEENVNVQSENTTVISSSGNTLTSVAAGVGRWRVVHDNYIGPWYTSQVFMDYSGDWYCASDNYGHNIKLRIPAINPQVIYGGTRGSSLANYEQYEQNSKSVAWAQINVGRGQKISNATGNGSSVFNVEIGPFMDCQFCNATTPLRPAWGCGFLTLQNQNRYGDMIYATPDKFFLSEIGNNGRNIMFVKQSVVFAPLIKSFSPTTAALGSTITIAGNNFTGTTAVSFGGTPASSFSVINDSTITAVVGSGTSGEIKIITPNGVASLSGFNTLVTGPEITSFSPTSGAYKTIITIIGKNFDEVNFVTIGGVDVTNKKIINSNTIEAEVPIGATSGDIKVESYYGTISSKSGFTFIPANTIIDTFTINTGNGEIQLNVFLHNKDYLQRDKWSLENSLLYDMPYISFLGPLGEFLPGTGATYNFSQLAISFTQKEGNSVVRYGKPESGTIKFTMINSRCVGTISNYKIFEYFYGNAYNPSKSITINGTFNVPVVQ